MKDRLIGSKLAHYRIERSLGRGGMAHVYYAWDESLDRPAAVKVINEALRGDAAYTERFVQEARAIARWRHPNILQVYYAGEQDDLYFFAMEYIDGLNLEQLLSEYGDQGELVAHDDVIQIGRAIASALDYAHSKHVIHRDVKPSNVMINRENRVVLADFGLAMQVQRGSLGETFGTPHYISPEQARNSADAVPQSDLYSLGIILYEMLVGVVPFDDPSSMSIALKHITEPPPAPRAVNPQLSEEVEKVLLKALEKEPAARYPDGNRLMEALADAIRAQNKDGKNPYALPPPPAGVTSQPSPPLSQLSIVERVALSAPQLPAAAVDHTPPETGADNLVRLTPPPSSGATRRREARSFAQWLALGGIAVLVFLVLAAGTFLLLPRTEGATPTTEAAAVAVATETRTEEAGGPPPTMTATSRPLPTITPSATDSPVDARPTGSVEPAPTETATVASPTTLAPSETPLPDPTDVRPSPTAPQPSPEPTIAFPDGHELTLTYNAHSFYLHNPSSRRLSLAPIRFEALDESGTPRPYALSGSVWTRFYPFIEADSCVRVEPWGGADDFLYPAFCTNYNASHRPQPAANDLFWIQRPDAHLFRVLWEEEEVARCPLADNTCTIFVPVQ